MPGEWKPDPQSKHELRYHDGQGWTDHVSDQGSMSVDPIATPAEDISERWALPVTPAREAEPTLTPEPAQRITDPRAPYGAAGWPSTQTSKGMSGRKVAGLVAVCSLLALFIGIGIGTAAPADKKTNVAATGATTTSTTLSPEEGATSTVATRAAPTTVPPSTVPPTTAPPKTAPPTTADPFANETVSQRNARREAKSYLEFSAFSRQALIKQLEYGKFSTADATYGTDAQKANWNEQAAKSAKSYLDFTSFSRESLIAQLEYSGFTRPQAEFGAKAVGF